jgi:hypothetical protein
LVLQQFKDELIDAILVGERALMYAFGFNLKAFEAHHLLLKDSSAISRVRQVPPGKFCVRVAWDLLEHGCVLSETLSFGATLEMHVDSRLF